MVIASLLNATIGVNILMLNPLSPQLIPLSPEGGSFGFTPELLMINSSLLIINSAPNF